MEQWLYKEAEGRSEWAKGFALSLACVRPWGDPLVSVCLSFFWNRTNSSNYLLALLEGSMNEGRKPQRSSIGQVIRIPSYHHRFVILSCVVISDSSVSQEMNE